MATTATNHTSDERGFSLIETLIAMAILATGLLSLAGVFIMGLGHLAGSSGALIAREKAREAVEKWTFTPAKKNGIPVAATITISTNFSLR